MIVVLVIPTLLLSGIRYAQYNQAFEKYITTGQQYAQEFEGGDQDQLVEYHIGWIPIMTRLSNI